MSTDPTDLSGDPVLPEKGTADGKRREMSTDPTDVSGEPSPAGEGTADDKRRADLTKQLFLNIVGIGIGTGLAVGLAVHSALWGAAAGLIMMFGLYFLLWLFFGPLKNWTMRVFGPITAFMALFRISDQQRRRDRR